MSNIYVLQLKHQKYYIGKTKNTTKRIKQHFTGVGSQWTAIHHPISILKVIKDVDDFDEDKYTKIYMRKYGIDNVRGGSYVRMILANWQYRALKMEFRSANNECFVCGGGSHFAKDCRFKSKRPDFLEIDPTITRPCIGCQSWYHKANDCVELAKMDICYRCGQRDHWKITCVASVDINGHELRAHPIGHLMNSIKKLF